MRNSKQLFQDFVHQLTPGDDRDEEKAIAQRVFENVLGLSLTDIMAGKAIAPTPEQLNRLAEIAARLQRHEPVQYILGEAEFCGRVFEVNPSVLIPRPETEQLVQEVLKHTQLHKVLDVGTGSGCIPITIALEKTSVEVFATDISTEALQTAQANARRLKANVTFTQHDILQDSLKMSNLDVVVSNPPYTAESEKGQMKQNVVDFEPHLALFVPNENPLLFYSAISEKAFGILKPSGMLAVEINERLGREVAAIFAANNFQSVQIVKDLSGKDRIVKGYRSS
jgi:release factor glutamine methyltransferase